MFDFLQDIASWENVATATAWLVTTLLLVSGLVGCVIPALPGHLLILIAAIGHRLMLGAEQSGLQWWSFAVLIGLLAISQIFEFVSGALGSRWFGGTRWGALGAFIGAIIGIFYFPFGLVLGPLIGAIACEMIFGKQKSRPATISGVGSVVGTLAGLGMKIAVGVLMTAWFVTDVFWID